LTPKATQPTGLFSCEERETVYRAIFARRDVRKNFLPDPILNYVALKILFGIPQDVWIVAYLCVGFVRSFADRPDLEKAGWRKRLPLEHLVHDEMWGHRMAHQPDSPDSDPDKTSSASLNPQER
jgi:hypothetical protein